MFNDTIYALSSGSGICAISLIRCSGNLVPLLLEKLFTKDLSNVQPRKAIYAHAKDEQGIIDDVVVTYFKAPATYTGEDLLEISTHGSPLIRQRLYVALQHLGLRLARNGEFSQRSVLNGKMTLAQAEGVNDMIHAKSNTAYQIAYQAANGSIARIVAPIYDAALQLQAHINVNIDYPEYEDIEQLTQSTILPQLIQLQSQLNQLIQVSNRCLNIVQGVKTVIVGKPNVGKSSLLNALLNENKAIVTDIAGTTRDVVEGEIMIGDLYLKLLDTAGIREGGSMIEQMGIEKSKELIEQAQCVIMVVAKANGYDNDDEIIYNLVKDKQAIIVNNKCEQVTDDRLLNISAATNHIQPLIHAIEDKFANFDFDYDATLTNARQISAANNALESLNIMIDQCNALVPIDLIELEMQNFVFSLKEIGGEAIQEDLLDRIFASFCVGK